MDFLAIDFETANDHRGSVCAIGIVTVRNGEIAEHREWLVRPKIPYFSPFNTAIHGINADHVRDMPEICDLWNELRSLLQGRMVIAHNASFDMSVLRYVMADYVLPGPEFTYSCTRLIGKQTWPGLTNYRLDTVAQSLGIGFGHHNALEDARASAEIAIRACAIADAASIDELSDRLQLKIGRVFPGGYTPAGKRCAAQRRTISDGRKWSSHC